MEAINYVEFKKERDLGSIISDTFKFIRLEWKPFFGYVFKIAIIPILIAVVVILYYGFASSKMFSTINFTDPENINVFSNSGDLFIALILMILSSLVAYVVINVGSLFYIKSYVENNGVVDYNYIKEGVKDKFWSFIGLGVLIGIIVFISAFLCFFPAIYTGVVLSLASCLLVFNNNSVMDAISNSFSFIKGHWWETFGCLLVIGILVSILGYIFSIPALIYQIVQGFAFFELEDPTASFGLFQDPIYLLLNVVAQVGQFIFYSVTLISTVLIYFDINEQKNASGTFETIDGLGK